MSNILAKIDLSWNPSGVFSVKNFVALFQYLFNFCLKNERTMFLYKILHFCSRHDVFLSESNAKIWEKLETINLHTYPTH